MKKMESKRSVSAKAAVAAALLLFGGAGLVGCGPVPDDKNDEKQGSDTAIMIAVFVRNPEGRNIYVGAVPELPTGELDYSGFLEFGDIDVSANGGYVFVWEREPATMTRYTVDDTLQMVKGPTISFANHGVNGTASTVYISKTRAYTLSPALDVVVIWDPEAMEITGTIEMTPPVRPDGLGASPAAGHLAGDQVIWPLSSTNFDGVDYFDGVAVAIAQAHTDDAVKIVEDTRCVGSDGAHVDAAGDFYMRAGGYWGSSAAYADEKTCMLRIKSGEDTFDPEYEVDFAELTGSYAHFPWYHVEGTQYLAHVWTDATPIPTNIDDYWDGAGLKPMLVDIATGEAEPYPELEGETVVSTGEFEVDGVAYYQVSSTGTAVGGSVDVVALRPDGITTQFTIPELWGIARIR